MTTFLKFVQEKLRIAQISFLMWICLYKTTFHNYQKYGDLSMTFANDKKTFLAKLDKSKKGEVDERIVGLLELINAKDNYYTTSSCSGRVYFWQGSGKKNETEWLKVSHDLISMDFLLVESKGIVWLRLEPLILHVCCQDLESANHLLDLARKLYKKSCLLSISNKIIVEIRGSEFLEMPWSLDGQVMFNGDLGWLRQLVNERMQKIWKKTEMFCKLME